MGLENNRLGYFGNYGGQFAPETLMAPLKLLEEGFEKYKNDSEFQNQLQQILKNFVGRPTALTFAERLTNHLGGARVFLKREDLAHTGAHKINNTIGQVLLAKKMGKSRVIAETGAGQHGVATATAAALFGLECVVFMGKVDMERQAPNVLRMNILGAKVVPVISGSQTLKDAISEAMRDWVSHVKTTAYILGSALGPHPYPTMVREFQSIIGREARAQMLADLGQLPDELVACVGGGSNAIGLFHAFLNDKSVSMVGVEAGGLGVATHKHAARFEGGSVGILQGTKTYILQDSSGQVQETHSISAGLDYAAVGPEHAWLREQGRVRYTSVTDDEALKAFHLLSKQEGIIPALESSHAVAYVIATAPKKPRDKIILINLSGRGDKDLGQIPRE